MVIHYLRFFVSLLLKKFPNLFGIGTVYFKEDMSFINKIFLPIFRNYSVKEQRIIIRNEKSEMRFIAEDILFHR